MITHIALENFKAFGAEQGVRLAPITLLFGANSSGKSSLMQSLLLLKQTIEEAENIDSALVPKGRLVNLGSYKELVFRHETTRNMAVHLRFTPKRASRAKRPIVENQVSFEFAVDADNAIQLQRFRLKDPTSSETLLEGQAPRLDDRRAVSSYMHYGPFIGRSKSSAHLNIAYLRADPELFRADWEHAQRSLPTFKRNIEERLVALEKRGRSITGNPEHAATEGEFVGPEAAPDEVHYLALMKKRLANSSFESFVAEWDEAREKSVLLLNNFIPSGIGTKGTTREGRGWFSMAPLGSQYDAHPYIERCLNAGRTLISVLEGMVYLGPLREYPERHYIFSGALAREVGKSGKEMPGLLYGNRRLVSRVNQWLRQFDVPYKILVRRVKDPDVEDVFTLRLLDEMTGVTVSPLDVGFGISQILPIMVQSLLTKDGIVCVEQPEIHLHPRLQAEFGSLLAEAIGRSSRNQFIIETHSEHLILRLQRLVRTGVLRPDEVAVIYVRRTAEGSRVSEIRLGADGEFLDRWPDGFFEEGFRERFSVD